MTVDLVDVEAERHAAVALDAVTAACGRWGAQYRRPKALSAREALAALRFEALVLWTAWANLRSGMELTEDDARRITVAMQRIDAIYQEAH